MELNELILTAARAVDDETPLSQKRTDSAHALVSAGVFVIAAGTLFFVHTAFGVAHGRVPRAR